MNDEDVQGPIQQLWKAPPIEMFKVNWDDVVDNPTENEN